AGLATILRGPRPPSRPSQGPTWNAAAPSRSRLRPAKRLTPGCEGAPARRRRPVVRRGRLLHHQSGGPLPGRHGVRRLARGQLARQSVRADRAVSRRPEAGAPPPDLVESLLERLEVRRLTQEAASDLAQPIDGLGLEIE